jgi:hypothetical protein
MRFRRLGPVVVALALVASACGDDTTGPQVDLTQQEIGNLFAAISAIFADFANFSAANPALSLSLMGVADDINETVTCPQGGSADVTGTVNETVSTFDLDVDLGFNECGSQGFLIGGSLNFDGSGSATETTAEIDLSMSGDLEVETEDGRSGVCTVDLDYSINVSQSSVSFSASGHICGESFNYNG